MAGFKINWKKVLRYTLIVVGVLLLALTIWVLRLDHIVTKQFEGRRWSLPAQVYAQPLELYAGQNLSADALEQELRRLGYQKSDAPQRPGTYRRRGFRFDFVSRQFRFVDEQRAAQAVSVLTGGEGIERMWDAAGKELPIFRLDPLLIGSIFPIHGEDRVIVTPEQVPAVLPAALKVVEDRQFDTHMGVNLFAIARAAWINVRAGQIEQGGSTLTQQLVRSYFLDNRRTFGRKIEEAIMAMSLEFHFDKVDLMNSYINEIPLGQEGDRAIHGFGLASQFYFGKPLNELELHEIATLVTVVRGPSYYDPRRHVQRARTRRNMILDLLSEFKIVTADQARLAKNKPLSLRAQTAGGGYYPAYLDLVRRTLRRDYRDEDLTEAGLTIFSALDPRVQSQAEWALTEELVALDKRTKRKNAQLEGVVVVTTPQSGEVIAIVGGRRVGFDGYNRALDAKRSIGSLVKPVIFLAAMESGKFHSASIVEDGPIEVKLPNGQVWKPHNINEQFYGPVPLARTLALSLNLATARLGLEVGLPKVTKAFTQLGLEKEPPQLPSVLLGALDIAPIEVAQMYNSLANGGFSTPLRAVRTVVDDKGTPLKAFALEVTPVADPAAVYQVNRMMQTVMENGSGRSARAKLPKELVVAGKSGTSSDYRDTWFAGFSGAHLAVVWVGFDDNQPTGLTGANGALPVWSRFMGTLQTRTWSEPLPEGLVEFTIDFKSGEAARVGCSDELVTVAVPRDTQLPIHAGCGEGFGDRMVDWLRGVSR
ncbi:MAG: penicillin-binding protein 1B [Candidatus Obscuribacterales bacterium]|nr:penicillin-binding protein 1B [Steroidobacteraceae bacterium]